MGFGVKTDFSTSRQYDLDKTYENIIKPTVTACGYTSVRADEILDSGLIDKSMYALLIKADLVIADITTLNPNALYELGIRHGSRANSTIILKDKDGKIPFDLDHNRFIIYEHLGTDVGFTEVQKCSERLKGIIQSIEKTQQTDSPLFEYISGLTSHALPDQEYQNLIQHLADNGERIFALTTKAKQEMSKKNFKDAATFWKKASEKAPEEHYFLQQQTLCTYKSEYPSAATSLNEALTIIAPIYNGGETNDPETLGLVGSIYKRLYETNNDIETLKLAIEAYRKGFMLTEDFYTGENYATCLDLIALATQDEEEKHACKYMAKEARKRIIASIEKMLLVGVEDGSLSWMYATAANCYYNLGNQADGDAFEAKFFAEKPEQWHIDTYVAHKPKIG